MNHHTISSNITNDIADGAIATLVKRFPKKWAAQIKRACEDSFAILQEGGAQHTTYSIRSGKLLYLCIPTWEDRGIHLRLNVEVVYQRATVTVPLPLGQIVPPERGPDPVLGAAGLLEDARQ